MNKFFSRLLGIKPAPEFDYAAELVKIGKSNDDPLSVFTIGKLSKILDDIVKDLSVYSMCVFRSYDGQLTISLRLNDFTNNLDVVQAHKERVLKYFGLDDSKFLSKINSYGNSASLRMTNREDQLVIELEQGYHG
jgi:hypothetical protein